MHTNYENVEDILNEMKKSKANIEGLKQRIANIEIREKELNEKYPNIDADEIISEYTDIGAYIEKRKECVTLKSKREELTSELMKNVNYLDELEEIKSNCEKKLAEKEENKNKYIEKLKSLLNKEGILKGKEASILAEMANELRNNTEINFLTEEDKKDYISQIDNKLSDNNNLINEQGIKIKEPKVKTSKKCIITDKLKSVVAKGKTTTINFMKNVFDKSIAKSVKITANIAQSAYAKAVANSKKEMRRQIEELREQLLAREINFIEEDDILEQMSDAQNIAREEEEKIKTKEKEELEKRKEELNQIKNQASMELDSDLSEEIEEVRTRVI